MISGGGTGGHIYPAIAIANAWREKYPSSKILFVGASGKMEMQKVPDAGYKIKGLPVAGLQRSFSLENLKFPFKLLSSLMKASKIVSDFRPDVVVGVGGYASGPVLFAAQRKGIPTLVQEQNSYAGLTNKILAKRAKKICVAYPDMDRFFPADRISYTGNPVRKDILDLAGKREKAITHFALEAEKKTLLVLGGSLGARTLNQAVLNDMAKLDEAGYQVIWQCGKYYYKEMKKKTLLVLGGSLGARTLNQAVLNDMAKLDEAGYQLIWQCGKYYYKEMMKKTQEAGFSCIHLREFIREMDLAYAAADVIVSRAGALSVSELSLVGKPVIFIPSPNVAEDHQTKNAMAYVQHDAAWLLKDAEAIGQLENKVDLLMKDAKVSGILGENIKKLAKPNAAIAIVEEIEGLIA